MMSEVTWCHMFRTESRPDVTRTDSQLEAVSCVDVDVFQRFLHGQSEQHQLTEVMPAVHTLLNTTYIFIYSGYMILMM